MKSRCATWVLSGSFGSPRPGPVGLAAYVLVTIRECSMLSYVEGLLAPSYPCVSMRLAYLSLDMGPMSGLPSLYVAQRMHLVSKPASQRGVVVFWTYSRSWVSTGSVRRDRIQRVRKLRCIARYLPPDSDVERKSSGRTPGRVERAALDIPSDASLLPTPEGVHSDTSIA